MSISRNKLLAIGAATVAAVVIAGVILFGTKRALDPMQTPLPNRDSSITAIQPLLDKLKPGDRQLVIGYLLLQRGDITSLSTHDINFAAKTFREAIEAQKALLAAKQVSPEWPLMRALEDQALRPLRDAVVIEVVARKQTTASNLFTSKQDAVLVVSGGNPDDVRTAMFYRIRNAGLVGIKHLTGYIQPQLVSDDWINILTHNTTACHVDLKDLAPGASAQVICSQMDLNTIGDTSRTPDDKLFIDWRPDLVEFADGSKLAYDMNALTSTLLWNHYNIDGDIK